MINDPIQGISFEKRALNQNLKKGYDKYPQQSTYRKFMAELPVLLKAGQSRINRRRKNTMAQVIIYPDEQTVLLNRLRPKK